MSGIRLLTVMDASEQFAFPSPQPQDAADVREAIEKAGLLWADDPKESLKWLRKAAEFASDAGDDLRSVQLARVSADLRALANISPSIPPASTIAPRSVPLPTTAGDAAPAFEGAGESQTTDASSTTAEGNGEGQWPAGENTVRDQNAVELQPTFGVSQVVAEAPVAPVAPTSAELLAAIPQVSFSKDPGQTLPATPAASAAAAALATAPAEYQSMAASPGGAPGFAGANGASGFGQKKPAAGVFGNPAPVSPGGPRPEQPTLVGRAPVGAPRGVNDETPAATPAAIQADSVAPGSSTRFVQHRAVAVAVSMAPNANGHFDLHPLADGESVEPGFRRALLVALAPEDRLFPGRG